jgi:hypothetical protein
MGRALSMGLVAVSLASGCYVGPVYKLKENKLTCNEPLHVWAGGLVTHVNQGKGDGEFDYAPLDPRIDRIVGLYDLDSGGFYWDEVFVDDSHVAQQRIDGVGTIWNDGDLDVEYDVVATMSDERTHEYAVRERRLGCEMQRWVESDISGQPDPTEIWEGEFTDGGFEYVHRFALWGLVVEAEGRTENDFTYEETLEFEDGDVAFDWYEERDDEMRVTREFDERIGDVTLEGYWSRTLEGELTVRYDYDGGFGQIGEEWSYTLDPDGDGDGELVSGAVTCDLDFDEFACELADCTVPSLDGADCELRVSVPPVDVR